MRILLQKCFLILSISSFVQSATRSGCQFKIPSDVPENEPVYLGRTPAGLFQLFDPSEQINFISPGQSLHLFCPGKNNVVQIIGNSNSNSRPATTASSSSSSKVSAQTQNMTQVSCNRQTNKFEVNNAVMPINRLNCTKSVMGDLRTTKRRCGPRSEAVINEIGFQVYPNSFVILIEACYNNRTASANFARYVINGKAIRYNVKESERRAFKENGIPAEIKANDAFKSRNQIAHFNEVLGAGQNFINATSYLSRGHLAADADFVFSSAQFATYFYVNVAPQFQAINAGNWLRVEKIARNLAMNYETDLLVYTGTIGQLKLPSMGKTTVSSQKAVYLHENKKLIVPQYFYKIILDERAGSAIVFVTSNNPFLHRVAMRPFCEDVCQRSGLDMKQFSDVRKGFTFCCEYSAFMEQVDISPFRHNIQRLLSCSNIVLAE